MANIKPFHLHLPKISQKQNEIIASLFEFLPSHGVRETFHLAIRKAIHQYIPDIRYYLEQVQFSNFHDFFIDLPNPSCVAVVGMEPFSSKAFIELDPLLSLSVIEKLLGGKGEPPEDISPLTETEQGVVEFLLLKILSQIHKLCGEKARMHFRLEQMILEPAQLRRFEKEGQELVCLKVHVALLNQSGFVNIYLPSPWILEGFLKDLPGDKSAFQHQEQKENLKHYDFLSVELWGEGGEATVSYKDLKNLNLGDVILFDETGLAKTPKGWKGNLHLHVGSGLSGGFLAGWNGFEEGGRCFLKGSLKGGKWDE